MNKRRRFTAKARRARRARVAVLLAGDGRVPPRPSPLAFHPDAFSIVLPMPRGFEVRYGVGRPVPPRGPSDASD